MDDEILPLDFLNIDDIIDTEIYKALNIKDYQCLAHILYQLNFLEMTNNTEDESIRPWGHYGILLDESTQ